MAVLDLGISTNATTSAHSSMVRFTEKHGIDSIYVVFSTELGADVQENIDCAVCFRYVKRPGDATGGSDNGWSQWSGWYWSRIPSSECGPHKVSTNSRWYWAIELAQVGEYYNDGMNPNPDKSIKNMLFPSGYALESRKYDAIEIQVKVKTQYYEQYQESQGGEFSDVAMNNSVVFSYVPNYYLHEIRISSTGLLDISYEAPAWQRNDDRYQIESIKTTSGENLLKSGNWWGSILGYANGYGYISIGTDVLKRPVGGNEDVYIKLRMNAGFNAIDQWFSYLEGSKNVYDYSKCSTPLLSVMSADENSVQIRLNDSKDQDVSYGTALCTLYGNDFETDMQTVENGGLYVILDPPLGIDFQVSAVGMADVGGTTVYSDSAWCTVPAIEGESKMTITPYDSDVNPVEIRYNVSEDWTYEPEQETVKFATRTLDSVAFGKGGSVTGTLEFDIVDDDRRDGSMYQDRRDFENLLLTNVCVLRGPDGERKRVSIESVEIGWDRGRKTHTVKIGMRQVQ